MRYFWSLIVALMLVTVGLNTARRAGERAPKADAAALVPATPSFGRAGADPAPAEMPAARAEPPAAVVASQPELAEAIEAIEAVTKPAAEPATEAISQAVIDPIAKPVAQPVEELATLPAAEDAIAAVEAVEKMEAETASGSGSGLSLDALLGVIEEAKELLPPDDVVEAVVDPMMEAALAGAGAGAGVEGAPAGAGAVGPAFTVRGDGAVEVEGAGVIVGDGSARRPYVIDWQVLRSVARDYNPKQGQEQLPDWVRQLDGKTVRVEGNTLLPVVAAAVDELLVMQNPWDGCCIGIPPTPYDAIEVKLANLTRMGNTPTGFGMVEGTFKVDPYIVQGWLLGLYVIENASFESAAGMELPGL